MWSTLQHQWPQDLLIALGFILQSRRVSRAHKKILANVKSVNRVTMTVTAKLMSDKDHQS